MARNMSIVKGPEKGFAKSVSTLFYFSKVAGIVPFDFFTYQRYNIFASTAIGTFISIIFLVFYATYYHFILTSMYFTKPGTDAGEFEI